MRASGGAGAQTDIKTFHELGTFGAVALTCIVSFDPKDNWGHRFVPVDAQVIKEIATGEEYGICVNKDNDALLYLNSMTTTVEIDSAGRVALGKIDETARGHRERLGLDGDLMVVGAGDHFEIWNAERWNAKFKPEDAAEKFESLFFVD